MASYFFETITAARALAISVLVSFIDIVFAPLRWAFEIAFPVIAEKLHLSFSVAVPAVLGRVEARAYRARRLSRDLGGRGRWATFGSEGLSPA